jgi:hypothetical protein
MISINYYWKLGRRILIMKKYVLGPFFIKTFGLSRKRKCKDFRGPKRNKSDCRIWIRVGYCMADGTFHTGFGLVTRN